MLASYRRIGLIKDYIDSQEKELEEYNRSLGIDGTIPVNGRRLTNVGMFRAYMEAYVRNHPDLHQPGAAMTLLVRQLPPSPQGLPIEIYAFTKTTAWEQYELIQADIFDHLLAAAPHFGLHVFQEPTGYDFARFAGN
jgi:miniconductance mechanosensitive channel